MKNISLLIFGLIILASCDRNLRLEDDGYLIFGVYNGFCAENCSNIFKIEDGQVYADDVDYVTGPADLKFLREPLIESSYLKAKVISDEFPDKLFDEKETVIGCPGCHDQDIVIVIYNDGSETWEWTLDTDENVIPNYLESYVRLIKETVAELKE